VTTLDLIAVERRRVADELDAMTPDQLARPSLCGAWTVHDIGAHLLFPLELGNAAFLGALVRSGFRANRANEALTARVAARSTADIAAGLRAHATDPFKPPTMPYEMPLVDVMVHGQDYRRPLGLASGLSAEALGTALGFVVTGKAQRVFGRPDKVTGLRYEATDLDWSHGDGSLVRGPGEAILMALCGRAAALGDLDGPGVDSLRRRMP
jgi:uncharacterized protein (TIGR03083 family)